MGSLTIVSARERHDVTITFDMDRARVRSVRETIFFWLED